MRDWIDVREALDKMGWMIKKRLYLVSTVMCLAIGFSAIFAYFVLPSKYTSSTRLIAELPESVDGNLGVNNVNFNLQMINTYKDIITKSNTVAERTYEKLKHNGEYDGTVADIKEMISFNQEQDSQMFSISVTTDNPQKAQKIANTVAVVFQEQVKKISSMDKLSILEEAQVNLTQVSPNRPLIVLLGALAGIALGAVLAFIVESFNPTIMTPKMAQDIFSRPLIGTISAMTEAELSKEPSFEPPKRKRNHRSTNTENVKHRRRKRERLE